MERKEQRKIEEAKALRLRQQAQAYIEKHACGDVVPKSESNQPPPQSTRHYPTHDNTLEVLAQRRAKHAQVQEQRQKQLDARRLVTDTKEKTSPWKSAIDPDTGDRYYWNENTQETTWENPMQEEQCKDDQTDDLPEGWSAVIERSSGDTYYWNQESGKTTWEKPQFKAISLEDAMVARSKLDSILESNAKKNKRPVATTEDVKSKQARTTTP